LALADYPMKFGGEEDEDQNEELLECNAAHINVNS